jgi:hypothetical protein
MTSFDYKKTYADAIAELTRLQAQKANHETALLEIETQIEATTRIANAAAAMAGELPVASLDSDLWAADADTLHAAGISVATKAAVDSEPNVDLNAKKVKDILEDRGWDWSKYVNPLSTLHTTLKRLADSGAIKPTGDGKYYSTKRRVGVVVSEGGPAAPSPRGAASLPMPKTQPPKKYRPL